MRNILKQAINERVLEKNVNRSMYFLDLTTKEVYDIIDKVFDEVQKHDEN